MAIKNEYYKIIMSYEVISTGGKKTHKGIKNTNIYTVVQTQKSVCFFRTISRNMPPHLCLRSLYLRPLVPLNTIQNMFRTDNTLPGPM